MCRFSVTCICKLRFGALGGARPGLCERASPHMSALLSVYYLPIVCHTPMQSFLFLWAMCSVFHHNIVQSVPLD